MKIIKGLFKHRQVNTNISRMLRRIRATRATLMDKQEEIPCPRVQYSARKSRMSLPSFAKSPNQYDSRGQYGNSQVQPRTDNQFKENSSGLIMIPPSALLPSQREGIPASKLKGMYQRGHGGDLDTRKQKNMVFYQHAPLAGKATLKTALPGRHVLSQPLDSTDRTCLASTRHEVSLIF